MNSRLSPVGCFGPVLFLISCSLSPTGCMYAAAKMEAAPVPLAGLHSQDPDPMEFGNAFDPLILNEPSLGAPFLLDSPALPLPGIQGENGLIRPHLRHQVESNEAGKNDVSKLSLLRRHMAVYGIDAYVVPSYDEHQNEYVGQADKRRAFITGFTGSEGTAVITANAAAVWTDGRYHLQASQELDTKEWTLMKSGIPGVPNITHWITTSLPHASRVGLFANVISYSFWKSMVRNLGSNATIVLLRKDLVDLVWDVLEANRPQRVSNPVFILPSQFSGETWKNKVIRLREKLAVALGRDTQYAFLVTGLDEIAWLLNLRGSDIAYNPVFYSYCLVTNRDISLFIDPSKINRTIEDYLEEHCTEVDKFCIKLRHYEDIYTHLGPGGEVNSRRLVLQTTVNMRIFASVNGTANVTFIKDSPISWMKVIKNAVEIEGMKQAQYRDSVALIDFISFLEEEVKAGKEWDELSLTPVLENYRSKQLHFQGLSFNTISGFGPNSAVIHYAPTTKSKLKLTTNDIFLLDSGAQYLDGTTDVTRTFHFGSPNPSHKEAYTRVLMGAINLAALVFPNFISGRQMDVVARQPLWSLGLDFRHGTGHGIGSFLNVHEGPIFIGVFGHRDIPFSHGMFVSDEPGLYIDNHFGIRLETIVMARNKTTKYNISGNTYLAFEAATLVPFEPHLISYSELTCDQVIWLEAYNRKCEAVIKPALLKQNLGRALKWFDSRITPLGPILKSKGCPP